MCRAPAAPAPLPSTPCAAPALAPPLPTPRWPFPRCSTSRYRRPSLHACRRLASSDSRPPCLFIDLKYVLELPTDSLLRSHTCISTAFRFPEHPTSPEPRRCLGSPSTAAATASHPRSSALAAPPRPTEAHKPAQFRSPALDRPDHDAGELELPPPLGLTVVPTIYCLLAPAKHTTSTTSSLRSFPSTSPPPSGTLATGTLMPPLGAPPPVSVHRRPAASALLFPNTGHPRDRRELLNLSPHFPLAAGEPPRRNLIGTDRLTSVARPRIQLQGFESFQGPFRRK
jgi:hypothetical protein